MQGSPVVGRRKEGGEGVGGGDGRICTSPRDSPRDPADVVPPNHLCPSLR